MTWGSACSCLYCAETYLEQPAQRTIGLCWGGVLKKTPNYFCTCNSKLGFLLHNVGIVLCHARWLAGSTFSLSFEKAISLDFASWTDAGYAEIKLYIFVFKKVRLTVNIISRNNSHSSWEREKDKAQLGEVPEHDIWNQKNVTKTCQRKEVGFFFLKEIRWQWSEVNCPLARGFALSFSSPTAVLG